VCVCVCVCVCVFVLFVDCNNTNHRLLEAKFAGSNAWTSNPHLSTSIEFKCKVNKDLHYVVLCYLT
jgi:hypothetical protein